MLKRYALSLLFFASFATIRADHFAGGTITTRCLGGNFHEITLQLFRNCGGVPLLPQTLGFSNDCGVVFEETGLMPESVVEVSPLCASDLPNSTCNGGTLIGYDLTTYRTTVFLSQCDSWRIYWSTCCRNASLNVVGTPGLWIETMVNNFGGACNNAPEFVNNTIPLVCVGQPVSYDGSAVETDGNTLRYHLVDAQFGNPDPVSVLYQEPFTGAEPITGMAIDSLTGVVTFLPTEAGSIITVVEASEYNSSGELIGTVMRDLLFVVSACDNEVPSVDSGTFTAVTGIASINADRELLVCGEGAFCASLAFADPDLGQSLAITSNITTNLPGATLSLVGTNPVDAEICWNTTGVVPGVYQFTITATDDACPVVGVQQFAYTINVGTVGSPGEDADIAACENGDPIVLFDALGGDPVADGTWTDPEGEPFDGIFVPGTSQAGSYAYSVSGSVGCARTAHVGVTIAPSTDPDCIGLGVREGTSFNLTLYPDPLNTQRIWLSAPKSLDLDLRVFTADGRLLLSRRSQIGPNAALALDLHGAAPGVHVMQVVDRRSGSKQTMRFVVL